MPIEKPEAELRLGSVDGQFVKMRFSIVIGADGSGRVRIFMSETNSRRSGELMDLGERGFNELREVVDHIEKTVAQMKGAGRIQAFERTR